MPLTPTPAHIIILNGVPRSGKSSIVSVIQDTFDGMWLNIGVDRWMAFQPESDLELGCGLVANGRI